jgi:hypothetical protein
MDYEVTTENTRSLDSVYGSWDGNKAVSENNELFYFQLPEQEKFSAFHQK